jgi:hypothetical protein
MRLKREGRESKCLIVMLKLEDFKIVELNNITPIKGGATTVYVSGSSSGGGSTSHDLQKDGDSTQHACAVDDNTKWGDIKWVD